MSKRPPDLNEEDQTSRPSSKRYRPDTIHQPQPVYYRHYLNNRPSKEGILDTSPFPSSTRLSRFPDKNDARFPSGQLSLRSTRSTPTKLSNLPPASSYPIGLKKRENSTRDPFNPGSNTINRTKAGSYLTRGPSPARNPFAPGNSTTITNKAGSPIDNQSPFPSSRLYSCRYPQPSSLTRISPRNRATPSTSGFTQAKILDARRPLASLPAISQFVPETNTPSSSNSAAQNPNSSRLNISNNQHIPQSFPSGLAYQSHHTRRPPPIASDTVELHHAKKVEQRLSTKAGKTIKQKVAEAEAESDQIKDNIFELRKDLKETSNDVDYLLWLYDENFTSKDKGYLERLGERRRNLRSQVGKEAEEFFKLKRKVRKLKRQVIQIEEEGRKPARQDYLPSQTVKPPGLTQQNSARKRYRTQPQPFNLLNTPRSSSDIQAEIEWAGQHIQREEAQAAKESSELDEYAMWELERDPNLGGWRFDCFENDFEYDPDDIDIDNDPVDGDVVLVHGKKMIYREGYDFQHYQDYQDDLADWPIYEEPEIETRYEEEEIEWAVNHMIAIGDFTSEDINILTADEEVLKEDALGIDDWDGFGCQEYDGFGVMDDDCFGVADDDGFMEEEMEGYGCEEYEGFGVQDDDGF